MYSGTVAKAHLQFAKLCERVPDLKPEELRVGPEVVESLPCEVPWMTPLGVGLINITDIRRGTDGVLEFQLADEKKVPYDGGTVWRPASCQSFWDEWPQ